jgi:hypothetical protein
MNESRIFWLEGEPEADAKNEKTLFLPPEEALPPRPQLSIRELFSKHYEHIRKWLADTNRPGVAIVAMDFDAVRGAAFLASKPDLVSTAIIGRHTQADLRLSGDPSLSLRHLALLVYPRLAGRSGARYRLLDLRTAIGFVDERGKRLRALEASGPAFVRCGRYAVLFFPAPEVEAPWPDDPEEAWKRIPDRLYLDEVEAEERSRDWEQEHDRAWEVDALPRLEEPPTLVHHLAGPQMAVQELVDEGEEPLGEIRISSSWGEATVLVGQTAARAGVLLGRSRRCDAGRVLSDRSISRVHLLIIEIAGNLFAVDTASYNGVWDDKERERTTPLEDEHPLTLAEVATVAWRSFPEEPLGSLEETGIN